jgi:pantoate--beta-alanine ligase
MGALHEGHRALIRRARHLADAQEKGARVVVSIFVNPMQFGSQEDLARYPRSLPQDRALCLREGVDLLFLPTPEEMYAGDASITVSERQLSRGLCGASRPGHFDGVCTVVAVLLQIVRPEIMILGEKDWQQLAVIRRMVRDLKISVKVLGHPTVRASDGLALSSRNELLTPAARLSAPRIFQALTARAQEAQAGELSVAKLRRHLLAALASIPEATIDYVEIVNGETLHPLKKLTEAPSARALVALRLGSVRLIDNIPLPFAR